MESNLKRSQWRHLLFVLLVLVPAGVYVMSMDLPAHGAPIAPEVALLTQELNEAIGATLARAGIERVDLDRMYVWEWWIVTTSTGQSQSDCSATLPTGLFVHHLYRHTPKTYRAELGVAKDTISHDAALASLVGLAQCLADEQLQRQENAQSWPTHRVP